MTRVEKLQKKSGIYTEAERAEVIRSIKKSLQGPPEQFRRAPPSDGEGSARKSAKKNPGKETYRFKYQTY